jgi:hypothetical protein
VKQGDLGEYEENAREKAKHINVQDKAPTPPQTKPYGWQTPIPPPVDQQIKKNRGVW